MTKDEALKLALEFIERVNKDGWILADFEPQMYGTITAIKEALAKPEPFKPDWDAMAVMVEEQQRMAKQIAEMKDWEATWVGLTRMDLIKCGVLPFGMSYELCQAIEAKLKQKNGYAEEKNT